MCRVEERGSLSGGQFSPYQQAFFQRAIRRLLAKIQDLMHLLLEYYTVKFELMKLKLREDDCEEAFNENPHKTMVLIQGSIVIVNEYQDIVNEYNDGNLDAVFAQHDEHTHNLLRHLLEALRRCARFEANSFGDFATVFNRQLGQQLEPPANDERRRRGDEWISDDELRVEIDKILERE